MFHPRNMKLASPNPYGVADTGEEFCSGVLILYTGQRSKGSSIATLLQVNTLK
jgi:hypothetical protein